MEGEIRKERETETEKETEAEVQSEGSGRGLFLVLDWGLMTLEAKVAPLWIILRIQSSITEESLHGH